LGQKLKQWTVEELPTAIPIFPLTGVLLLPGGRLPLNIFEPRYLEMTEDAMSSHRVIGMIQPADPTCRDFEPQVYDIGCAGQITEFKETEDNRVLITLTGLCRFDVVRELPHDALTYRRVNARYQPYECDLIRDNGMALDRDQLIGALKKFFEPRGMSADWSAIEELCNEDLMTSLVMACPFGPSEKQALLECRETEQRSAMFQALLEMAAHERDGMVGAGAPQ
jgi:Lon protease-like protein